MGWACPCAQTRRSVSRVRADAHSGHAMMARWRESASLPAPEPGPLSGVDTVAVTPFEQDEKGPRTRPGNGGGAGEERRQHFGHAGRPEPGGLDASRGEEHVMQGASPPFLAQPALEGEQEPLLSTAGMSRAEGRRREVPFERLVRHAGAAFAGGHGQRGPDELVVDERGADLQRYGHARRVRVAQAALAEEEA